MSLQERRLCTCTAAVFVVRSDRSPDQLLVMDMREGEENIPKVKEDVSLEQEASLILLAVKTVFHAT